MCMELSQGEQLTIDATETAKENGTALFEILTVPTTSRCHGKQQGDSQSLINSSSMEDADDGIEKGAHTTGRRKRSSAKTVTMDIDACWARSSPKGMISDGLQKDLVSANLIKSHYPSASLIKQTVSGHATSSDKTGSTSNRELSTSRTESMNVNQVLSHVQESNISNSNSIIGNSTQEEPHDRWLKLIRDNPSDAFGFGAKRMKIRDGPTSADMCSLLSEVRNYNTSSYDMMKHPEEQQIFDRTKYLPNIPECSYGLSVKEPYYWIQRWCHKRPQKAESQASVAKPGPCEPENPKVVPENFEGKQLPSIRAMALMGRTLNSFRTGEFQRKGSSVVWNTEEL